MFARPGGDSSDEEDEFSNFSTTGDIKTLKERQKELTREFYIKERESENTPQNKLYSAILNGNLNDVRKEFDNGYEIDAFIINDYNSLYLAASLGKADIVEYLLNRGANAKVKRDGFTILMAACNCTKQSAVPEKIFSIVQNLLKHEVDVLAIDRKRRTALMLACEQGFLEVVKLLLPLNNLEAEDNQGWTPLFYAVNENKFDVVKYLLENGANLNHNDIRDNNIKYYATRSDFQDILKLLPEDDDEINPDDLILDYNYDNLFKCLTSGDRPTFKSDISLMLYGMKCNQLIKHFTRNNIDLMQFLTLSDQKLKDLGIMLSFQRNWILQGLFRFHKRSWTTSSLPLFYKNDTFTSADLFSTIITIIKHLTIMEASIQYLINNIDLSLHNKNNNIFEVKLYILLQKIQATKQIVGLLHKRAIQYDEHNEQVDEISVNFKIRKNRLKINLLKIFGGISAVFIFRYFKSRVI